VPETPTELPAIQLAINVQPRGKNQAWVEFAFVTPLNMFSIAFPPDQAEAIADNLPEAIRSAVSECRRVASGLILSNEMPKE